MKYKEVKWHYDSGDLKYHYFLAENGDKHGECRTYYENGKLRSHEFSLSGYRYGEVKWFNKDGTLEHHYLVDGNSIRLAYVVSMAEPSTHSEEQLIQIAKEHGLPLLSELPKTEAELTHWNLKYPDIPCIPYTEVLE